jgi:hypothetical protein
MIIFASQVYSEEMTEDKNQSIICLLRASLFAMTLRIKA